MALVKIKNPAGEVMDCHEEHLEQFLSAGCELVADKPKAKAEKPKAEPKAKAKAKK